MLLYLIHIKIYAIPYLFSNYFIGRVRNRLLFSHSRRILRALHQSKGSNARFRNPYIPRYTIL